MFICGLYLGVDAPSVSGDVSSHANIAAQAMVVLYLAMVLTIGLWRRK